MKRAIISVLSLFFLFSFPTFALANSTVAEQSAQIKTEKEVISDTRAQHLEAYLEKFNSPLAGESAHIVKLADTYNIQYTWVVAISGVESTHCKAIPTNSYNCWGWANGEHAFDSWGDGVEVVTRTLRTFYVDRGADTIEKIAPIYAPPSHTWAKNVKFFIEKIENFDDRSLAAIPISL